MVFLILHEGRLSASVELKAASMTFEVPPLISCDASMIHGVASMHTGGLRWIFKNAEVLHEASDGFSKKLKFASVIS